MGIYEDIQRAYEIVINASWPPEPSPLLADRIEIGDVATFKSTFPVAEFDGKPATIFAGIPVYTDEALAPNEYVIRNSEGRVIRRGRLKVDE